MTARDTEARLTKPYRFLFLLTMGILLAGCADNSAPTTFRRYEAGQVLAAFEAAGLSVQNPQRAVAVAPDVPSTFSERYTFEIESIAPSGGVIMIFGSAANMQTWLDYVERQRGRSETRRNYIFVFRHENVLLQISPDLLDSQANAYRDALNALP